MMHSFRLMLILWAVLAVEVLYCKVADVPYVGALEAVAVPSKDKILLTVGTDVSVLVPELKNVRL